MSRDSSQNIKVAVRVRPFNDREKENPSPSCVEMEGNTTYLRDPKSSLTSPKRFTFDKSYWSHDEFVLDDQGYAKPVTSKYIDQVGKHKLCSSFILCCLMHIVIQLLYIYIFSIPNIA